MVRVLCKVITIFVVVSSCLAVFAFVALGICLNYGTRVALLPSMSFDSVYWQSLVKDKSNKRESMAKDIVSRHLLDGMTKQQVRQLLGDPVGWEQSLIEYPPGVPHPPAINSDYQYELGRYYIKLYVHFENERVKHVYMGSTGCP